MSTIPRPAPRAAVPNSVRREVRGDRATRFAAALLAFLTIGSLAAADGGYWPTAWGWGALALLWVAALALVLAKDIRLSPFELAWLAALAALVAWTLLSGLWSTSVTRTVLEAERALLYLAGVATTMLVVRSSSARALLGGTLAASVLISTYALLTRLLPDRIGVVDPIAGYRLSEPIGYWNGLGIFAAMGTLLAASLAARGASRSMRAAAGASLPILLATLFFSFSRGAWAALIVGVAACLALDRRRAQLLLAWLASVPPAAIGVYVASRSDALTRVDASAATTVDEGHRLILVLTGLALVAAIGAALAPVRLGCLPPIQGRLRFAAAAISLVVTVSTVGLFFERYGSPWVVARSAYRAFTVPAPPAGPNLNDRLLDLSGNRRDVHWRVAWQQHKSNPWLGSGAGTYEQHWLRSRPFPMKVRDAHSLYLETLGELGPVGLALVMLALATPLVAVAGARGDPLIAGASGAYVTFLVHAGVDWDWELPAVTLSALFVGAAMVALGRSRERPSVATPLRFAAAGMAIALAAVAVVGLYANTALAASAAAADAGAWAESERAARRAIRWAPWSSTPWRRLGDARLVQRDFRAARRAFRVAAAKEPRNWETWFDLSLATTGGERRRALERALRLNPLSPEIAESRALLGLP